MSVIQMPPRDRAPTPARTPVRAQSRMTVCPRTSILSLGLGGPERQHDYDVARAAQIVAYFGLRAGRKISIAKAMTLVYLADRESLRRNGETMLDEPRMSLPGGAANRLAMASPMTAQEMRVRHADNDR